MKLPFVIVLGDSGEFASALFKHQHTKVIDNTKYQGWTLEKTEHALYWLVSDLVKNLHKQFIHYNDPVVYIIVNFKTSSYLEQLEKYYELVRQDLILREHNLPTKIRVIGIHYVSPRCDHMKKHILEWCIKTKRDGNVPVEYLELTNYDFTEP